MPLPIDSLIPAIVDHLRGATTLVLEAPPGAGKTTRVPPALLALGDGEVLVLEPRRLAARLAARFVAGELGETVGGTVGYQVRFEEVAGPRTRLRFLTEGVLTRRLLCDPLLKRAGCVVLDEFHERHLEGDLALALLRRLQRTARPDLRMVVMSATLDAAPVAAYLGGARVMRSRRAAVSARNRVHAAFGGAARRARGAALERLAGGGHRGQCWCSCRAPPRSAARRRRARRLRGGAGGRVLPLHGDQSPEEQDRAVAPAAARKVILATNVAESSITIDGVTAVIDCGCCARGRPFAVVGAAGA